MTDTPHPTTTAVLVSFNSEDDLPAAIASVPDDCELVVVEQSAHGFAAQVARAHRPDAIVVQAGANRGFGAGCNLGAANATGETLLFLNPDAVLHPGAAAQLSSVSVANSGAVTGPSILDDHGTAETEARRWSGPVRDTVDLLLPRALVPGRLRRDIPRSDPRYTTGGPVSYVQGSCFAVGREAFFGIGGFDEQYFLYGEEEYLSRKLAEQGVPTLLVPKAHARHVGHTSTDKVGAFAAEQLYRARILTYRDFSGRLGAAEGWFLLSLAFLGLWCSWPLRSVIGYRADHDANACRASLRGLWLGLCRRPVRPPIVPIGESSGLWGKP